MEVFLSALLTTSLSVSPVIVLLILLNKLTAPRVSAAFRYYMWLIVLAGLIVPCIFDIPVPFDPVPVPWEAADLSASAGLNTWDITSRHSSAASWLATAVSAQKFENSVLPALSLFLLWLVGALTVLAAHWRSYRKFSSTVRRWSTNTKDMRILAILQAAQSSLGLDGRHIEVKICEFITSPMLLGFRHPAILLPKKAISSAELKQAFLHELTHYKRQDLWIKLLVLFVTAIHWFNPFAHLMARAIRADCEAACDGAVIRGKDIEERRSYGEMLIGFAAGQNSATTLLSTYFYERSSGMKKRLSSIMDTNRQSKALGVVCAAALFLLVTLSGGVFAESGSTAPKPSPSAAPTRTNYIGEAQAKSVALSNAGISESEAAFVKVHLDYEMGRAVYDIEFYSGSTEYDYEIDAATGTILEYDRDIEFYAIPSVSSNRNAAQMQPNLNSGNASYIGEAKAKSIAFSHAGLSESQVAFFKIHFDYDDGRPLYDIEFYASNIDYEYEIDATTGTLLKSDIEYDN